MRRLALVLALASVTSIACKPPGVEASP